MTPEMLASLRERFDTGRGPIRMSEIDMLITYAQQQMEFMEKFDAWRRRMPNS